MRAAGGASVLRWIPGVSRQTKALDPNSEFMEALGLAWAQSKAEQKVATRFRRSRARLDNAKLPSGFYEPLGLGVSASVSALAFRPITMPSLS